MILKTSNFNYIKMYSKTIENRSSRPDVFCKKGGLTEISQKFTGKHLR